MIDKKDYLKEYITKSPAKKIILGCYDKNNNIYMLVTDLTILYQVDYKVDYDSKSKAVKLRIKDNKVNKNLIIDKGVQVANGKLWDKAMTEWLTTHKQANKGMVFENLISKQFEYQTPHSYKGVDFIDKGITYECKFVNASIQHY